MVGDRTKKELNSTGRDIFTWLILASVFFIPLQLPVGATSRLSLADLFVVLASPLLLLRFQVVRRAMLIAPLLFPLIMVYGALLGGLVNGQVLSHAMVAKVLGAVVLLFSLLSWLQVAQESERGIFDLMKAFLLGSVVFTLFGLVEFYAGVSIITVRFIESRFSGGYFDPNHYGALTGVGLVFIAALGRDIFQRDSSIYVVGGILGVGLLLCISRGAWIASVFGILVVVVMRPIKIKAPVIALGVIVILGVIFSGVLEHLAQDINDRPDNGSHRMELITEGLRLFKDGHYVGIGLSVFLEKNEIIIHNSVVWMTVEMGVVGIALYLLFIGEPVVRLMRLRFRHWGRGGQRGDQIARISASLLGAHLLMAVASQLVEATYQRQWWLVFALTVGLLTRTNVSSTGRLPAFILNPNKLKTSWAKLSRPKSGWPAPWGPLWGNTGIKQEVASGTGKSKSLVPDLVPTNEQGESYNEGSNDTLVSDPTVLLSIPISDSVLAAYDQAEEEKSHSGSADKTSTPGVGVILVEDDHAPEKEVDVDSETQYLPMSELVLTDEEQAEQENNCVNSLNDPFVSDGEVIAENESAIDEETDADSETQYLPIQEINHSNNMGDLATSDDVVILPEDEIATEKGTEVGSETQYLPTSELLQMDKEHAEQEMNRVNNSKGTFIYTTAAMLAGNDTETEKGTEVGSETQYLPTSELLQMDKEHAEQEMNRVNNSNDPFVSDGDVIAENESAIDEETDADSETQYLPTQEINHSNSMGDPATSDDVVILPEDEIATEKGTEVGSETQYLPTSELLQTDKKQAGQEINRVNNSNDPFVSDGDVIAENESAIDEETDANSETQYLPIQEINHSNSMGDPATSDDVVILPEDEIATEKGTKVGSETQYLPTSELLQTDKKQAEQEMNRVNNSKGTFIYTIAAMLAENNTETEKETDVDSETHYLPTQEIDHSSRTDEPSTFDGEVILTIDDIETEKEMDVDSETHYLPTQEIDHSDRANDPSIFDVVDTLEEKTTATEKGTNADSETRYLPVSESTHVNNGQTDQETRHSDDVNETSVSDVETIVEEDDITRKDETNVDAGTQYLSVSESTQINNGKADQETRHSDDVNETSVSDVETIIEEDDITTKEETNIDTGAQYLPASESILVNKDQAEQETNHSVSTHDAPISDPAVIIIEKNTVIEEETRVDADSQYLPISNTILISSDQAHQEINLSEGMDDTSASDAEVILEEDNGVTEKEANADSETKYLQVLELNQRDNDQAEEETTHSNGTNDTSTPGVEDFLAEKIEGARTRYMLSYDIEEIIGFGKQYGQRLRELNIDTIEQLLNKANTSAAIAKISKHIDKKESLIRRWISIADLIRVPGVRGQFAKLITQSGVLSIKELAAQDAQKLTEKISDAYKAAAKDLEVTAKGNHYRAEPDIDMVTVWIDAAKSLTSNEAEQETNHLDSVNETALLKDEATLAEDDIAMEEENLDAGKKSLPVSESTLINNDQAEQEMNHIDSRDETSLPHTAVVLLENDIETKEEWSADSETQLFADLILNDNDQFDQEIDHSDSVNDTSPPDAEAILVEDTSIDKDTSSVDAGTQYLPVSESTLIDNDPAEQEINHSDSIEDTSIPNAAAILEVDDSSTDNAANVDTEAQNLPASESILMDADQAEQETNRFDSTDKTYLPDAAEILAGKDTETKEESSADPETQLFTDTIFNNNDQIDQKIDLSASVNDTSLPEIATILVEENASKEKEINSVDGGTQNLPIREPTLIDNDQAEQEINPPDSIEETSIPDAAVILEVDDSSTDNAANVDTETQNLPASESILMDSDQAEQETNYADSTDETSQPDPAETLVENNSATEKETGVDAEIRYLPISESILTDNDQAEHEMNRSNSLDETFLPGSEVILAEDDGDSWMRGLDYDIEEIKGIGKRCSQLLREIDIDTTQQLLEKAGTSAAITEIGHQLNNEESLVKSWVSMADLIQVPGIRGQFAEQIMQSGVLSTKQLAVQDARQLAEKISGGYELTQKSSEVATKENRYCSRPNIDMIAVWIDAAKKLNKTQSEQGEDHSVSANDTAIHEAEAVLAESDNAIEKEMNVDAGKELIVASDSPLIINDKVEQEMNHPDNTIDTSIPFEEMISAEESLKEKAMNTDSEVQYIPISELILTDSNRTDQEMAYDNATNNPSTPDVAVTLVENNVAKNKEKNIDAEIQYVSISESILINNVQAEQEINHLDNTNDTSIPTVAMILTEDVGGSLKDLRDYAIEEIRGIGNRIGQRLREMNIETTLQLLQHANTSAAVAEISRYVDERESLVRAWISTADLMRVPGIRGQFADLLVLSGVLSVKQLGAQDAQELTAKNLKAIAKDNRYYAKPNIDMVAVWIDAAKELNDEV